LNEAVSQLSSQLTQQVVFCLGHHKAVSKELAVGFLFSVTNQPFSH